MKDPESASVKEENFFPVLQKAAQNDVEIRSELRAADIKIVEARREDATLRSRVRGKIGPVLFQRAPRFWMASGPVPLEAVTAIMGKPASVDIHIGGDPREHALWFTPDGVFVAPRSEEAGYRAVEREGHEDVLAPIIFDDEPAQRGATLYVPTYRIDSVAALASFARGLRRGRLANVPRPGWWDRHPVLTRVRQDIPCFSYPVRFPFQRDELRWDLVLRGPG